MSSSSVLPICRVDWRPSNALAIAIGVIGLLAVLSLVLSALPTSASMLLGAFAIVFAIALVRQELRREPFAFVWAGGDEDAVLNFAERSQSLSAPSLHFRGPLASLRGLDEAGRRHFYLWWPDTLSSAARRQLRLIAQVRKAVPISASTQQTA